MVFFFQMSNSVSCPEQILCPKKNQLNIRRLQTGTQPPSASPPPPSPVYDVSIRITLHLNRSDTYMAGNPISVLCPCSAPLRTVHVSILFPVPKPCTMPCAGGQHPSLCQQHIIEQRAWGQRELLALEVEGPPEVRREDWSSALLVVQSISRTCFSQMEIDDSEKWQREKLSHQQLFRGSAVIPLLVSVAWTTAVLSWLTSSLRKRTGRKQKDTFFGAFPFPLLRMQPISFLHSPEWRAPSAATL